MVRVDVHSARKILKYAHLRDWYVLRMCCREYQSVPTTRDRRKRFASLDASLYPTLPFEPASLCEGSCVLLVGCDPLVRENTLLGLLDERFSCARRLSFSDPYLPRSEANPPNEERGADGGQEETTYAQDLDEMVNAWNWRVEPSTGRLIPADDMVVLISASEVDTVWCAACLPIDTWVGCTWAHRPTERAKYWSRFFQRRVADFQLFEALLRRAHSQDSYLVLTPHSELRLMKRRHRPSSGWQFRSDQTGQ